MKEKKIESKLIKMKERVKEFWDGNKYKIIYFGSMAGGIILGASATELVEQKLKYPGKANFHVSYDRDCNEAVINVHRWDRFGRKNGTSTFRYDSASDLKELIDVLDDISQAMTDQKSDK